MKTIYTSKDGKEFDNISDCLKHEVETVMSNLNPRPDSITFDCGLGCVQQNKTVVRNVINNIQDLIETYYNNSGNVTIDAIEFLKSAVMRLKTIDCEFREWYDDKTMYCHVIFPILIIC